MVRKVEEKQRKRAPSKRSLETRARILDAAEQLFSERGFEGASIRDIAKLAEVPSALVQHHGGSKEALFETVVARRAEELSRLRLAALDAQRQLGPLTVRSVLVCFLKPFLDKVLSGDPRWNAYGRLIAHVSADVRWREIAERNFDPTARLFLEELQKLLPNQPVQQTSACLVFTVSAMLSVCTSSWRIGAIASTGQSSSIAETLIDFCEAGISKAPCV